MDASALDALPLFAPAGRLVPELHVVEQWDGGYRGTVTVTNTGRHAADEWSLTLYLPEGWTVSGGPQVRVTKLESGVRADPVVPALSHLAAGDSASFDVTVTRVGTGGDAASALSPPPADEGGGAFAPRWMGFNLASWWGGTFGSQKALLALADLASSGANVVAIVPTRYVADQTATEIIESQKSEPDDAVIAMIRAARKLGLTVVLKPHLDPVNFASRHHLAPSDPERFFANYQDMIVHYARMAQAEGVGLFVIGTELVDLTRSQYEGFWRRLIKAVRGVFNGPVTYAANYGEDLTVPFWDALDYIGVDMYAPLVTHANPTVDEVVQAWLGPAQQSFTRSVYGDGPLVEAMAALSERHGRPILFTEIGYQSIDGAGTSEAMTDPYNGPPDPAEQAVFYEGMARAMVAAHADWLAGVLFWDWSVVPPQAGSPPPDARGFSVAGKPAERVFETELAPLVRSASKETQP